MKLELKNFGKFDCSSFILQSTTASNGAGKTTLVNAYLFALTGKCLTGFVTTKTGTPQDVPTSVELTDFAFIPNVASLRRVLHGGKTTLYVDGNVYTQTDFVKLCAERGIDIELAAACADVNVLTDPQLTSERLRKLLVQSNVLVGEEYETLRKEQIEVRKKLKTAQQYALSNVVIPTRTVEPLTEAEEALSTSVLRAQLLLSKPNRRTCETCGALYNDSRITSMRKAWDEAAALVAKYETEHKRIADKCGRYNDETQAIQDAERLIANAQKAASDVQDYEARLEQLDSAIRASDAAAVNVELPEGVQLVTASETKSGKETSVCTLTYDGVPLKSVNRAKRVEICVRLLDKARNGAAYPIILDNAESVQGLQNVANLIRMEVG